MSVSWAVELRRITLALRLARKKQIGSKMLSELQGVRRPRLLGFLGKFDLLLVSNIPGKSPVGLPANNQAKRSKPVPNPCRLAGSCCGYQQWLRWLLVVPTVLSVAACASGPTITQLNERRYPRVHPNSVQLITDIPSRPFKELAIIEVETITNQELENSVPKLREAAAELGAHAVILQQDSHLQPGRPGSIKERSAFPRLDPRIQVLRGFAIRYNDQP